MGLNKKTMAEKVGVVLLFLMAFTATVDAAGRRLDRSSLLMKVEPNLIMKSTTSACCDTCMCTRSEPPQCQCRDIGETCHSACKTCICALSYPPQCRCLDVTSFCYDKCSSDAAAQ